MLILPNLVLAITAPDGCGLISCARVIGQAVCVAKALDDDNWKNIFKCAKAKQVRATFPFALLGEPFGSSLGMPALAFFLLCSGRPHQNAC